MVGEVWRGRGGRGETFQTRKFVRNTGDQFVDAGRDIMAKESRHVDRLGRCSTRVVSSGKAARGAEG